MVGTTTRLFYMQDREAERFWDDFEWNIQGVKRWPEDVEESITTIYLGRIIFHAGPAKTEEATCNQDAQYVQWLTDWAWGIWLRLTRSCPKFEDQ